MVQTAATDPRVTPGLTSGKRMMIYEVELPDGRVAEIEAPEGVTQPQLMEALGLPSTGLSEATSGLVADPAAQAARPANAVENLLRGGVRGLEEAGTGTSQLLLRTMPGAYGLEQAGITGAVDEFAQRRQAEYEASAAGQSGTGDVGRFLGGTVATAPVGALSIPAKGASLTNATLRAAAGGALAGLTATPAVTDDYWAEKAPQGLAGATLGSGILLGGRGLARTTEEVANAPRRAVNFMQERANRKPLAIEGEELAARTGIPLTPGMVSGGRAQTFAENMARQSIFTADRAMDADIRVAEKALEYVNKLSNRVSRNQAGPEMVGVQIQGAVRNAVERTAARREEVAAKQYGAIHQALGGRPIVQYDRTREVLERIANPGSTLSGDDLRAAKQAQALLARIEQGKPVTLERAIRDRSSWGRATRGDGSVFSDIDKSSNRRFAAQLYGAIQEDISAAAARLDGVTSAGAGIAAPGSQQLMRPGVGLGDALREADKNYRLYSEALGALEASPMARLLGDDISVGDFMKFNSVPPETVVKKLGSMAPSELAMTRDFMQQNAPETWQQYKRLLIDDAIEQASFLPASQGVKQVPISAGGFIRALGGDKPDKMNRLKTIFSAQEMRDIDDALNAFRRMGDKFGTNYSGTDPRAEARSVFEALKSGSGTAVASTAGELSGMQAVSRVMLNSDGRRAVIELSKLPPNARRVPALMGYLSALAAGQQMAYPQQEGGGQR